MKKLVSHIYSVRSQDRDTFGEKGAVVIDSKEHGGYFQAAANLPLFFHLCGGDTSNSL